VRKYKFLTIDLIWVALSPFAALFLRDNFDPAAYKFLLLIPYALICLLAAGITFGVAGLHQRLWRYAGLTDVVRIMVAVTAAILLALFVSFALNRLEGVARSLPVIQWLLLVAAMVGARISVRILRERARQKHHTPVTTKEQAQRVLVVGLNHITVLYLRSIEEFAHKNVEVVGILAEGRELKGRILELQKVLGPPEHLLRVLGELEVHGIIVDRIAVTEPLGQLSEHAREALLIVERSGNTRVDWLIERLGFDRASEIQAPAQVRPLVERPNQFSLGRYAYVKRAFDIVGAILLICALAPFGALIALVVALDLGLPVLFWQHRPGRHGLRFKLYKFRTMRGPHDRYGNRIPDDQRHSSIGRLLRWTRLDELPQLFNIMVGEMSFVGPRPLLEREQPFGRELRLVVRPGLTGLAQVNGRRDMPIDDKDALDIWYIANASFWLDLRILFLTLMVVTTGEKMNHDVLSSARAGIEALTTKRTEGSLAD
jgi:lipopolysaccharide/colanic/teichoic acid biosynthesis glycosyltransferase